VSGPLWRIAHRLRVRKGKEIAERLAEKYGQNAQSRSAGQVLWLHALSVGESLALVPRVERALLDLPEGHELLTTSTATSPDAA